MLLKSLSWESWAFLCYSTRGCFLNEESTAIGIGMTNVTAVVPPCSLSCLLLHIGPSPLAPVIGPHILFSSFLKLLEEAPNMFILLLAQTWRRNLRQLSKFEGEPPNMTLETVDSLGVAGGRSLLDSTIVSWIRGRSKLNLLWIPRASSNMAAQLSQKLKDITSSAEGEHKKMLSKSISSPWQINLRVSIAPSAASLVFRALVLKNDRNPPKGLFSEGLGAVKGTFPGFVQNKQAILYFSTVE